MDFGADYILTICGICINLFSENRSLIISSDCDIKIISDLIYNEIFPRYYAEMTLKNIKNEFQNDNDFKKYLEPMGFNSEEDYKKMAINQSKVHMKYCYLNASIRNDIEKDKFLHIFNPKENRLYIYDIILPLKNFLIGLKDYIQGKTQIINDSIKFRCSPIDLLEIYELIGKKYIYNINSQQKKSLVEEIMKLKGNKESIMEIDKNELKKVTATYFSQNNQTLINTKNKILNTINN